MKDRFMKNGVFSLEYDKETLRDIVLELQEENKKQKEVIEEVRDRITIKLRRYINEKDYVIDDVALDELLQILDKVKDNVDLKDILKKEDK